MNKIYIVPPLSIQDGVVDINEGDGLSIWRKFYADGIKVKMLFIDPVINNGIKSTYKV